GTVTPALRAQLLAAKPALLALLSDRADAHANGIPLDPGQNGQIGQNSPPYPRNPLIYRVSAVTSPPTPGRDRIRQNGQNSAPGAPDGPPYVLITDQDDLPMVMAAVDDSDVVGLDCETTGLCPRTDRVRLLQLDCDTCDGGRLTYVIDCFR